MTLLTFCKAFTAATWVQIGHRLINYGEALLMARHAALRSLLLKAEFLLASDCCRLAAVAAAPAGCNARKPEICMEDSPGAAALCQMCQVMQGSHKAFFELLGVAGGACRRLR